jgi:hypothetical protein
MKRLILFIGFIALTSVLFAQTWQPSVDGYIQTYPQIQLIQHNTPNAVNVVRNADTTNALYGNYVKYLTGDNFYSFIYNKKLYMLSYDECSTCYKQPSLSEPITRGLYLFRLDSNGWTKACYEPIQIDYFGLESSVDAPNVPQHNIWSLHCYIPRKKYVSPDVKEGSVTVSADGEVTIVLINYNQYVESDKAIKNSYENKIVTFVQNDGELFTIKK